MIKRHHKPLALAAAAALAIGGTALAGGRNDGGHGKPSVVPPPWSNGHCPDGSKPPCKGTNHG